MIDNKIHSLADIEAIESTPLSERQSNLTSYSLLSDAAQRYPDKTAIKFMLNGQCYDPAHIPDQYAAFAARGLPPAYAEISYRELWRKINQTANLLHSLGVGRGDTISFLLPNLPETHYALWGGEAAGVVNPINPQLEEATIRDLLIAAETKVLIALGPIPGTDIWSKVEAIIDQVPGLEHALAVYGKVEARGKIHGYHDLIETFNDSSLDSGRVIEPADIASMFHTGGTTGTPKLARRTHANEASNCAMMNLMFDHYVDDRAVYAVSLPLFHCNAAISSGLAPLSRGREIVLLGVEGIRSPHILQNFYDIVEHHKVSTFSGVPTIFAALLQLPEPRAGALRSLRFAFSGAAPMPLELYKSFKQKTGVPLLEGYGMTEGCVCSSVTPVEPQGEPRVGSIGLRLPYTDMKTVVLDERGNYVRDCAVNEVGVIVNAGPHIFKGYKYSQHNSNIWLNAGDGKRWFNTGDLGRVDVDGYFWLTGRKKELIIRGGHNIDPKIIEEVLCRHPAVALAAAVGRPDAYAGELPVAYVKLNRGSDVTAEALLQFARDNIAERAAAPKHIYIRAELPLTAVGKIFKPQLVWWQIAEVYQKQIGSPNLGIEAVDVEVKAHAELGILAKISLHCARDADMKSIRRAVDKRLRQFVHKYTLHLSY